MPNKIGIDLDNTVADFLTGAAPLIKELYGLEPDWSKPAFSIEEVFGINESNRPKDMRKRLYVEMNLFRNLPKLESDNNELPLLLQQAGFDRVYFVTARDAHPIIVRDTLYWVSNNMDYFTDVFHVDKKAEFCKYAGISTMIEDEVRQAIPLLEAGVNVVLMDRPWNQHIPVDPHGMEDQKGKLIRVESWRQALVAAKEFLV